MRILLTTAAMVAFAGNSLLCREALAERLIDAGSFTALRLLSGAVTLVLLILLRRGQGATSRRRGGNWASALCLSGYAVGFSFAYLGLSAATGALLLFGAVQVTMIGAGLAGGERLSSLQTLGVVTACGGLVALLLPGLAAPPLGAAALMLVAGVCWGGYSLRGRGVRDPTRETAGNFVLSLPFALVVLAAQSVAGGAFEVSARGALLAVASGALTSGLGYAVWYAVVPQLKATSAATVQLSVPVLAAVGGVLLLGEPMTGRLLACSVAVLGGVAAFLLAPSPVDGRQRQGAGAGPGE